MTYKRYFRNFMIDASFQLEYTLVLVFMLVTFSLVFGWFTYVQLDHIEAILLETAEVSTFTLEVIRQNLTQFFSGVLTLLVVLVAAFSAVIFIVTRRIAEAKYAIIKHINDSMLLGKFENELVLRKQDYLKDVASELNKLGKSLVKSPG